MDYFRWSCLCLGQIGIFSVADLETKKSPREDAAKALRPTITSYSIFPWGFFCFQIGNRTVVILGLPALSIHLPIYLFPYLLFVYVNRKKQRNR
jgi:hypothetical protein